MTDIITISFITTILSISSSSSRNTHVGHRQYAFQQHIPPSTPSPLVDITPNIITYRWYHLKPASLATLVSCLEKVHHTLEELPSYTCARLIQITEDSQDSKSSNDWNSGSDVRGCCRLPRPWRRHYHSVLCDQQQLIPSPLSTPTGKLHLYHHIFSIHDDTSTATRALDIDRRALTPSAHDPTKASCHSWLGQTCSCPRFPRRRGSGFGEGLSIVHDTHLDFLIHLPIPLSSLYIVKEDLY